MSVHVQLTSKGKFMKAILRVTAAAALATVMGSASAGLAVSPLIGAGSVLFSDNSAERWFDENGNGKLDNGDRLRGIFTIDTIEQGGAAVQIGGQSDYNELTGLFDIVVTSTVFFANDGGVDLYDYAFAASGLLAGEFGVSADTAAIVFEDSANDYTRQNCDFATCEASASGGSIWAAYAATLWTANNAADNPNLGAGLPQTTPLGTFGVALDFTQNNTGIDWNKVKCADSRNPFVQVDVDFCGQGGILASGSDTAGGPNTPYAIFNNIDFTANAIPEPGTLGLVGLALAGIGAATRRRQA
jgi:hypothetical protein